MTISTHHTLPYLTVVPGDGGTPREVGGAGDRADWQRMWLRAKTTAWQTLALVPGDDQISTFEVANLIARLAYDHGESVRVADLRALRPQHIAAFLEGTRWEASQGTRILFATRSASENLATISLARAADCAMLCVSLGSTSLAAARDTVEQVGRKHFLGSVLVRATAERRLSGRPAGSQGAGHNRQPWARP